jgi:putative transposase
MAARPSRRSEARRHVLLRREGWKINKKVVYRIYTEEGLTMRRKRPRRRLRSALHRRIVVAAAMPDQRWGMDFVADQLADGAKIRVLTIVDHFSRESPAIVVGRCLRAADVVRGLERLRLGGRKPHTITMDNGSEFVSKLLDQWAYVHDVELDFIQPGKPVQNAFIESFNGKLREECLNANWFETIHDARREIEAWRLDYNRMRPHASLGHLTPREFRQQWTSQQGGPIEVGI